MEFAPSQDRPQLPGGRQDLGKETSWMWAADSGAVLVARPLGLRPPDRGALASREVLCAQE